MADKRRGLGKGLGALIPSGPQTIPQSERPVDLLFRERAEGTGQGHRNPLIPLGDDESAPKRPEPREAKASAPAKTARKSDRPQMTTPAVSRETTRGRASTAPASPQDETSGTGEEPETMPATSLPKDVIQEHRPPRETPDEGGDEPDSAAETDTSSSVADPSGEVAQATRAEAESPVDEEPDTDSATAEPAGPDLVAVPGAAFVEIPVADIRVNPRQPRTVFDEEALEELRQSILQVGILQPIVVRSVPGESGYELIMGERRWRASQAAGLIRIPAIVRDTSDDDLLRDALLENLHRSNLNPLEEAAAYDQLLTDFGCTHEELAARIGRSRPQISNTIRLLRLPALVQRRVAAGVLSSGHARALLSLADPAAMERLAQRIVAEGLSVRATEEIVSMGAAEPAAPRTRRPATRLNAEALDAITTRLSDVLETRVSAAMSKRKGRLTIEFADMDDLNRILTGLTPGGDGAPDGED